MFFASLVCAKGVYLSEAEFLQQVFQEQSYCSSKLWLSGDTKKQLQNILERKSLGLRQRYWRQGSRTAWVMNEVGKELPITLGVLVEDDRIRELLVLEYRESRGGEIRHDFFTRQFQNVHLTEALQLSQSIDGITGATLSVRSASRVAKAALYLHKVVVSSEARPGDECL